MTIELGQITGAPPAEPSAPRLGRSPLLALLLLLVCALVVGEQPVGPTARQVVLPPPAPEQTTIVVEGADGPSDRLLLTPESAGPAGWQMTARRLPGMEQVWQVPVPFDVGQHWLGAVAADEVVLVTWRDRDDRETLATIALDRADGTTRWRRAGAVYGLARTGTVLLHDERTGTLEGVDPPTGRVRWSSSLPEQAWPLVHEPGGSIPALWILFDRSGRLEVRELDSNRLLGTRDFSAQSDDGVHLMTVGDILFLVEQETYRAYGLPDLTPRWELAARFDNRTFTGHITGCGAMPCLAVDADGLRALDPRTGAVLWSSPRWRLAVPAGEHALLFDFPLASVTWEGTAHVADPATGRVLRDLGSWTLLEWFDESVPMIGMRRILGGRLMLAVLHPTGPEVFAIVDESPGGCNRQPDVVICRRLDGTEVAVLVPDEHRSR